MPTAGFYPCCAEASASVVVKTESPRLKGTRPYGTNGLQQFLALCFGFLPPVLTAGNYSKRGNMRSTTDAETMT